MRNSKQLMSVAGVIPRLRLGEKTDAGVIATGPHKVKILEDKIVRGIDPQTNREIEYVRYFIEENGEKKQYDTKLRNKDGQLSYLVQRLAEIEEGAEVIMEMKKRGIKNYVSVTVLKDHGEAEIEEDGPDMQERPDIN